VQNLQAYTDRLDQLLCDADAAGLTDIDMLNLLLYRSATIIALHTRNADEQQVLICQAHQLLLNVTEVIGSPDLAVEETAVALTQGTSTEDTVPVCEATPQVDATSGSPIERVIFRDNVIIPERFWPRMWFWFCRLFTY
jgi:hypothetical protein